MERREGREEKIGSGKEGLEKGETISSGATPAKRREEIEKDTERCHVKETSAGVNKERVN